MQFSSFFAAAAVFAVASAKVAFQNPTFATVTAGQPFELTWTGATGPVSIILRGRQPGATITDPGNLAVLETIQSGLTGTSYTWTVPATIPHETYAFQIKDSVSENYSTLFEVIGGVTASSSVASRTSSSVSSASGLSNSTISTTASGSASASASLSTSTKASSTTSRASASATSSPTTAPSGGMATGLTSNLALVFVVVGALFMLN